MYFRHKYGVFRVRVHLKFMFLCFRESVHSFVNVLAKGNFFGDAVRNSKHAFKAHKIKNLIPSPVLQFTHTLKLQLPFTFLIEDGTNDPFKLNTD